METKQKTKRGRVILTIILPVLLIMGTLAISGHADKPPSPPGLSKTVEVKVIGDIWGTGDPAGMRITFSGTFGDEAGEKVANPDGPLSVSGPRKQKRLRYYYCDGEHESTDKICSNEEHDPSNYKSLSIMGGTVVGKGRDQKIVFPAGSPWRIGWKEIMGTILEGVLTEEVTYQEID